MKTNAIIRIIVWALVLVLLTGILVAFVSEEIYLNDYAAHSSAPGGRFGDTQASVPTGDNMLTFDPSGLNTLQIEWVSGNITVLAKTDITQIRVRETFTSDSRDALICRTSGNKLTVRFREGSTFIGIHNEDKLRKDLVIEVPADWDCGKLELDIAAADLEIRDMILGEVDIDGASGTCDFVNCTVDDLDIDTASGDVTFAGTLQTLDFDAASASFTGEFRNTPRSIDMDGMSGKLDIALPEDCGYTLTMDGVSSRLSSDFQGSEIRNEAYVYGDGRCRIQVDGVSCDVIIRKG